MTIAGCYVSPEGIVFGADSATTYSVGDLPRHYNHAQKLFQIGTESNLAVVTWGLGGLEFDIYRRLFAIFADTIKGNDFNSVEQIVFEWRDFFWEMYSKSPYSKMEGLGVVGFCIGGFVNADRMPAAWVVIFQPNKDKPGINEAGRGFNFWGAPNVIDRMLRGFDINLRNQILSSEKWSGTEQELDFLLQGHQLGHLDIMPIRDAIDFMHSCMYSTIKWFKFSHFPLICGGPIEIAVITTDRPFRWVLHKEWDSAIREVD